jgi:hypothetical protein
LPEVNVRKVYNALLRYKGEGKIKVEDAEISFSLNPIDIHDIDSPDCLLWADISLKMFGQNLKLRVPIPVEAEKGGIYGGALEDLKKFIERKKYPLELPMLVIAEAGYDTKEQYEILPVRITINQIPVRLLERE